MGDFMTILTDYWFAFAGGLVVVALLVFIVINSSKKKKKKQSEVKSDGNVNPAPAQEVAGVSQPSNLSWDAPNGSNEIKVEEPKTIDANNAWEGAEKIDEALTAPMPAPVVPTVPAPEVATPAEPVAPKPTVPVQTQAPVQPNVARPVPSAPVASQPMPTPQPAPATQAPVQSTPMPAAPQPVQATPVVQGQPQSVQQPNQQN